MLHKSDIVSHECKQVELMSFNSTLILLTIYAIISLAIIIKSFGPEAKKLNILIAMFALFEALNRMCLVIHLFFST